MKIDFDSRPTGIQASPPSEKIFRIIMTITKSFFEYKSLIQILNG